MITDLEPDILGCEVKWALRDITTDNARGSDGIPVELFQTLEDNTVKVLESYASKLENSPVAIGLENVFSFQSRRKTMLNNVITTAQLHSSHTLAK